MKSKIIRFMHGESDKLWRWKFNLILFNFFTTWGQNDFEAKTNYTAVLKKSQLRVFFGKYLSP